MVYNKCKMYNLLCYLFEYSSTIPLFNIVRNKECKCYLEWNP